MSLNLDKLKSVKEIESYFSTKTMSATICNLNLLVKKFGKHNGIIQRDTDVEQYSITITYLKFDLVVFFEFDFTGQFTDIIIYNNDQTKKYLRITLTINDDSTIKYIENDRTGTIPTINEKNIILKPGEYLINFAHCFLSFVGLNRVRLDDDSLLIIKKNDTEYRIKLWLYCLITKGKSWYSKFGYSPPNVNELEMTLNDIKNIDLGSVTEILGEIISYYLDTNESVTNKHLVNVSKEIVQIIGSFTGTLENFTKSNSIELFSTLTNNLDQSVFAKKIFLDKKSKLIEFPWYQIINNLFMSNVCQINNNITTCFCSISD